MYELYTRYSFELMLNEYMKSHDYSLQRENSNGEMMIISRDIDPGLFIVRDNTDKIKYEVHLRCKT